MEYIEWIQQEENRGKTPRDYIAWRKENCVIVDFANADLRDANLVGSNLSYANLSYAKLYYANLVDAHLRDAKLYYADFANAKLVNADLRGAHLRDANLEGANLTNAILPMPIGMSSRNDDLAYSVDANGNVKLYAGCWNGSVQQFIARINAEKQAKARLAYLSRALSLVAVTGDSEGTLLLADAVSEATAFLKTG